MKMIPQDSKATMVNKVECLYFNRTIYMKTAKNRIQNQQTGKWGEELALTFLQRKGLRLLEKNFRTSSGEIDLIFMQKEELIFVEVKTRRSRNFGSPEEAVDDDKLEHLEFAIEAYFNQHPEHDEEWRLDIISIVGQPGDVNPEIEWFENVITA